MRTFLTTLLRTSQCSSVWKTGTIMTPPPEDVELYLQSQCSPVWKTGTISASKPLPNHVGSVSM